MKLISPLYIAVYSMIIFVLFALFPPQIYQSILGERNKMFFDFHTFAYVSIFLVFFVFGSYLDAVLPKKNIEYISKTIKPVNQYYIWLTASILALFFSFLILYGNNANLLLLFFNSGAQIKSELETDSTLMPIIYACMAVAFYGFYLYLNCQLSKLQQVLTGINISLLVFIMTVIVARYLLIPFLISMLSIYLNFKFKLEMMNKKLICKLLFYLCIIILIFISFQLMRGGDPLYGLLGYGPASFNRLSALLSGDLVLNVPKLYYLISLVKDNWSLYEILTAEHDAVANAGLDGALNWMTAYGYIYYSLGWFSLLYAFGLGLIYKYFWCRIRYSDTIAIIVYPWLFSCSILWFTYNILSYSQTLIFLFMGFTINFFEVNFGERKFKKY